MSELKMSDVFELPVVVVNGGEDHLLDIVTDEGDGCCVVYFGDIHQVKSAEYAAKAINSYDTHVEQIEKLTRDVEVLRGALRNSNDTLKAHCRMSGINYSKIASVTHAEQALAATEPKL